MKDNGLSLAKVFDIRAQAFAQISEHAFAIDALAAGIAEIAAALQTVLDDCNIDDQQALVTSARHLARFMDGGQA